MARLNVVIPDELDRELDLYCVNKSMLARRGLTMALAELKKNLGVQVHAEAANDAPAPAPAAPVAPNLDDLIGRGSLLTGGQLKVVFPFSEVCSFLDIEEKESANDMIDPPTFHDGRDWVTKAQVIELCTLSPHLAKAETLKQWA